MSGHFLSGISKDTESQGSEKELDESDLPQSSSSGSDTEKQLGSGVNSLLNTQGTVSQVIPEKLSEVARNLKRPSSSEVNNALDAKKKRWTERFRKVGRVLSPPNEGWADTDTCKFSETVAVKRAPGYFQRTWNSSLEIEGNKCEEATDTSTPESSPCKKGTQESPLQEEDFPEEDLTDSQFKEFEEKVKAAEKGVVAPKSSVPSPSFQSRRKVVRGGPKSSARAGSEAAIVQGSRRCKKSVPFVSKSQISSADTVKYPSPGELQSSLGKNFPQIKSPAQHNPLLQTKQASSKSGGSKSPGISSQISSLQRQIAELKKLIPREGTSATRLDVVENQVHRVSLQVNENTAELVRLKRRVNALFKKF